MIQKDVVREDMAQGDMTQKDMAQKGMRKNDTAVVKITDIGVNGEGIGKGDGDNLFIKEAVIGDTVEG